MHIYFHLPFSLTLDIGFLLQLLSQFTLDWIGDKTINFSVYFCFHQKNAKPRCTLSPQKDDHDRVSLLIQARKGRDSSMIFFFFCLMQIWGNTTVKSL